MAMRHRLRRIRAYSRYFPTFFAAVLLATASGCLSLGGSTTYVEESAETKKRISSLESRMNALEQMLAPSPDMSELPVPMERVQ